MSEKRFFGFTDFSNWVRGQVTTLSEYLNLKLGEADTRLGEMDTKLLNKADQSALDLTNEAVATKANQNEVSDALDSKLNADAIAVDSAKLGGQEPTHFATAQAVTQLEADVNTMLTDLTAAFNAGTETINAV